MAEMQTFGKERFHRRSRRSRRWSRRRGWGRGGL